MFCIEYDHTICGNLILARIYILLNICTILTIKFSETEYKKKPPDTTLAPAVHTVKNILIERQLC